MDFTRAYGQIIATRPLVEVFRVLFPLFIIHIF